MKVVYLLFGICLLPTLIFGQDFTFYTQTELNSFDPTITSLSGDLILKYTYPETLEDPIVDLSPLENLTYIDGDLELSDLDATSLEGLNQLEHVGGFLIIHRCDYLAHVDGLANLNFVGDHLSIFSNDLLSNVDGFLNLTSINLGLSFHNNESLTSLDGFANLNSISGGLDIIDNDLLLDVDVFSDLNSIDGYLRIDDNDLLSDIDGFSNLNSIEGYLNIRSNNSLPNVDAFSNLSSIKGHLFIYNNDLLSNLNGFTNITSISVNLTSQSGRLAIQENELLSNVDAFSNLISIEGDLIISDNPNLSDCCIFRTLLSSSDAIGGESYFSNNNFPCNTEAEIFDNCEVYYFVNPPCLNASNGSISIQMSTNAAPYQFTWENTISGQSGTGTANDTDFIISNLAEGTYNISITNSENNEFTEGNIFLSSLPGSIFEIIEITTTNSSNSLSNGAIQLNISGGFPPYTYQWSGTSTGSQSGITDLNFLIPDIEAGEYTITVTDNNGSLQTVSLTLLDEAIPIFPCTQPLDIVILNDVSSSVDVIEYAESKQFFVDFLEEANIGTGADESRAAIIEWSDATAQSVQIPIIDDLAILQNYINNPRTFGGDTAPHEAMTFGKNYLDTNARPNVEKVLILSTDGTSGQVSPSLIALSDQFKAEGYHIITVAFDNAFSNITTREILRQVASIDLLAPGAPAYSLLNEDLAENIVNIYLCPIDPGSSATVYFERDGAIDILDIEAIGGCPSPEFTELTFSIEALRELSIPSGMPVTFYYNNPAIFGATPILTWEIPCAIEAGTIDIFTVSLPITSAANLFAVLNDDGILSPPIQLPLTEIDELAYSNNVADTTTCVQPLPTLQTFKYTTTPVPICNNTVIYQVNVCNIASFSATGVVITDDAPTGFILVDALINDNGCSTANANDFDIPANCCVSITYIYDASAAANGNYDNQGVDISGVNNQLSLDFDSAETPAEDVFIDGTVDCPSTEINFTKSVNVDESCDDAFVVYTFTIDNQLNIPLNAISFSDLLPEPVTWAFQPYDLTGLSISNANINGNSATFLIDEIAANTVASFSMDAALNDWTAAGNLNNTATLSDVLDLANGSLQTLTSNSVSTLVNAPSDIQIEWSTNCTSIDLTAFLENTNSDTWEWQTLGDGNFSDSLSAMTTYTFGTQDSISNSFSILVKTQSECGEVNRNIEFNPENLNLLSFEDIVINPETNGNTNGSAEIIAAGGLPPYTYEWSTGENSAIIENLAAGDYNITLTDAENCSITSSVTVSFTTGRQQESQDVGLELYPNPAHDFIDIYLSETAVAVATELTIIDAHGRILQRVNRDKLREGQLRLPTRLSGVYFLSLKIEGGTVEVHRFVVVR